MAKMFYSLDEAAAKLKKSENEVRQMAAKGEITEFRDGDRLIFKVDQINLLAGDDDAGGDLSSMIPLADSAAGGTGLGLGLADSSAGSGVRPGAGAPGPGGGDAKERTGISVFDPDELEVADASAQTQVDEAGAMDAVNLDNFGSGSGLMDLTREADDSSLGATGLMGQAGAGAAGGDADAEAEMGGGLFEGSGGTAEVAAVGGVSLVAAEAYDPRSSGLAGGLALGSLVAMGAALAVALMGIAGAAPGIISQYLGGQNMLFALGGLLVLTFACGGIGFALSKNK